MNQLGDLEKILSAAKEIGENFQKELTTAREENYLIKTELEELREENKTLREENEKIYIEMNNLRAAKENTQAANEAFTNSVNQLVAHLEENHRKTMAQISQILGGGLQKFVDDYMRKFQSTEENIEPSETEEVTEVETTDKYQAEEITVENIETAIAENTSAKKNKMQYAAFYAEEAAVEKDAAGNPIKMQNLKKPQ